MRGEERAKRKEESMDFEPKRPRPFDESLSRRVDPVTVWAWVGALSFCAGVWGIAITWLVER